MTFHTKRSPSQAKRFLTCPGALAFCDALPDAHKNQSGIAAQMGTAAHGLVERCLKENSNPEDYRGRIIELIGEEESVNILRAGAKTPGRGKVFFEVDSDMIDGAEMMTTYVRRRCKELGVGREAVQTESRTNPLPDREEDDTSGTADVTIDAWPTVLEVVDYKNGYNVVEHEDNEQLMAYLLGKALESDFAHESYSVTVVQPNAPHEEGRVRSFDATKADLLAFQKRYRAGIERCEVAEAEFEKVVPFVGPKFQLWAKGWLAAGDHCLFCDAQAVCPARAKLSQSHAKTDFAEEPRELTFEPDYASAARILEWAPQMESLIKAANLFVQRGLEIGKTVTGWKLVRGRSTRHLREDMPEPKLVAAILKGRFVTSKAALYTTPKLLTGPAMEHLVPKAKRELFNKKFLVKPEGGLTVTRASDPRPAVICSAADDFKEADSEDFG